MVARLSAIVVVLALISPVALAFPKDGPPRLSLSTPSTLLAQPEPVPAPGPAPGPPPDQPPPPTLVPPPPPPGPAPVGYGPPPPRYGRRYQIFRLDLHAIFPISHGTKGWGHGIAFEPKVNVLDRLAVGLRTEAAVMGGGSVGPAGTDVSMTAFVTLMAKVDFFFTHAPIRPFVGCGFGLGVVLALKHFSAQVAVPGAIFTIWCILSASLLVNFWRRIERRTER